MILWWFLIDKKRERNPIYLEDYTYCNNEFQEVNLYSLYINFYGVQDSSPQEINKMSPLYPYALRNDYHIFITILN